MSKRKSTKVAPNLEVLDRTVSTLVNLNPDILKSDSFHVAKSAVAEMETEEVARIALDYMGLGVPAFEDWEEVARFVVTVMKHECWRMMPRSTD